jgi:UDP-N-acetylmuramoylalanine--D-glutamate ligase
VALRSFSSGVRLILGGVGKGQDFRPLAPEVAHRCASVHVIGEDGPRIAAELGAGLDDGTLEAAVAHARQLASPGDVVLLSPACASFDQFADFEARGDAFRRIVG